MDLDEIKRGLRAEIKKRENEQYFTFQCNVRQMCKDVLAKIEEQETEIAELKAKLRMRRPRHTQTALMQGCVRDGSRGHCTRRARIGRITEYSFDLMPTRRGGRIWNANA